MELNEKALQKDIKKYLKTYAEAYCKQAAKEITQMASYAIQKFYDDYTPRYYNRTDDLLKNSYSPYYHDNGKAIYGGVRISSANMQPYKGAGISQYEIASTAWLDGLHGFRHHNPSDWILTFPPVDMVLSGMQNRNFLNRLNEIGSDAAKKQSYSSFSLK